MKNEERSEYVAIDSAVNSITRIVIGCAYTVSNSLGCGFLEKVYESALVHELIKKGLRVNRQHTIKVQYDGIVVGEYIADLVVEDRVLVRSRNPLPVAVVMSSWLCQSWSLRGVLCRSNPSSAMTDCFAPLRRNGEGACLPIGRLAMTGVASRGAVEGPAFGSRRLRRR